MKPTNDNHAPPTRIVLNECLDEHDIVTREPVAPQAPERMTGAARGAFEDAQRGVVVRVPTWGRRAA